MRQAFQGRTAVLESTQGIALDLPREAVAEIRFARRRVDADPTRSQRRFRELRPDVH